MQNQETETKRGRPRTLVRPEQPFPPVKRRTTTAPRGCRQFVHPDESHGHVCRSRMREYHQVTRSTTTLSLLRFARKRGYIITTSFLLATTRTNELGEMNAVLNHIVSAVSKPSPGSLERMRILGMIERGLTDEITSPRFIPTT